MKKSLKHNLTRIALVEAILRASQCTSLIECSCDYCVDLSRLQKRCGLIYRGDGKNMIHLLPTLIGVKEEDALEILSIQLSNQKFLSSNIFQGFTELPDGAKVAYQYYSDNRHESDSDDARLKRQTAFILVSTALPDAYLEHFSNGEAIY